MDCNFQSKIKPIDSKVNGCKMANKSNAVQSTNSSLLVKPRTMSAVNASNQARPTSPKITKRINSSSLVQPNNYLQSNRMNNVTSRLATNSNQQKSSAIKKPTSTFQSNKPLTVNSSANRLTVGSQSSSKLANSRTSSSSSIIKGREPKKLVKDTINNSSFVPREKLEKLTKKHEELTNKYNSNLKVINRNELTVDALSCLISYMAFDLDAFECTNLKKRVHLLERVEQDLNSNVENLNAEIEKLNNELNFERHRSQKEKENLLEMFEVEMKSVEKNYEENLKVENSKREKAEKDLLFLKQSMSKDKRIDFLNKEIESLKTVLELREREIKDLRYKLDRTFVDQDEISQLRNENNNLSLAKEQLEYSLNMKNEELKFVLNENNSLASLNSLTSTPLNNDRNNNVVKRRKNAIKKQKLDSNEKEDNFLKPMDLNKELFKKPLTDYVDNKLPDYFNDNNEINKSMEENRIEENATNHNQIDDRFDRGIDDFSTLQPLVDEINFIKPLIDRPMSLDNSLDHFKRSENEDHFETQNIEKIDNPMETSFNRQMDISLDESLNKSIESPIEKSFSKSLRQSFDRSSNRKLSDRRDKRTPGDHNYMQMVDKKDDDDVFVKPFDINEIKERVFAKPIDRESPIKSTPVHQSQKTTYEQQQSYIKTFQILNDENEISIVRNKKPDSVLDSGFVDL